MLLDEITDYIGKYGSISVAEYMRACNTHYYATRDPFGAAGDFTTAPEISQVFGELIGAWIHDQWQQVSGAQAVLCEAGPGRGTLMKDLLRVTRNSGILESTDVALIETSPTLRELQARNLKQSHSRIKWYDSLNEVPQLPFFFIANEFFDALPIHQYVGEQERAVAVVNGRLSFIPDGNVTRETSPISVEIIKQIASRIKTHGGAAVIIDYGYDTGKGANTLQAVKDHKYVTPLETPGESDLTAHVDFLALKKAAQDAGVRAEIMDQGTFLTMAGITLRAEALCQNASEEQKEKILLGVERLVSPSQMGILFKVLTITGEAARE